MGSLRSYMELYEFCKKSPRFCKDSTWTVAKEPTKDRVLGLLGLGSTGPLECSNWLSKST